MILKIKLYFFTSQTEIDHTEECFLPEEMLDKPYHFAKEFPEDGRELLKVYTVHFTDSEDFCVINNGVEPIDINLNDFESFTQEIVKGESSIEFSIIPTLEPVYDTLTVSDGKETLKYTFEDFDSENRKFRFPSTEELVSWLEEFAVLDFDEGGVRLITPNDKDNVKLDKLNTQCEKSGIAFELSSNRVKLNEYDPMDQIARSYYVSRELFDRALGDAGAAYRMAQKITEQCPEALEIIARYMEDAAELGSIEAMEWLKDYRSDDGRFDAWS